MGGLPLRLGTRKSLALEPRLTRRELLFGPQLSSFQERLSVRCVHSDWPASPGANSLTLCRSVGDVLTCILSACV